MTTTSGFDDAAVRAGARAAECRARLDRLRNREPITAVDAERAREALRRARVRAVSATVRTALLVAPGGAADRPDPVELVHVDELSWRTAIRLVKECTLSELIITYLSLGGSCSSLDIDAFVHGVTRLPRTEVALLEHAIVERD